MYYIHTTIKKYLLSHLILCGLLSLSANLHAALSTEQSDLQKRSHYTPSTHNVVNRSPKDWTRPINPMPTSTQHHIYPPQLLTMVTHNPDTQYYCTHLFPSHTLLPNSNTYQLNYHLIKSPFNPGISQTPLFLAQPPKLRQCTPSNVLQYVPTNSQRQHQSKIFPTTRGHNAFYNPHFSHHAHQMTSTPVNSTYPTNPSAKNNSHYQHARPNYPHSPAIPVPQLPSRKRPKSYKKIPPQKNQPYLEKWFKAANTGDTADLEALYQSYNIHVDNRDTEHYTALLLSAENGHLEAIAYLLQQGANIHAENKWHNTALLLSAENGHLEAIKYLLQQGANIQDKNANGYTALLLSAENGHLNYLKYLIQQGAHIEKKNQWGNTALILSAYRGNLPCLKFLVQQGADIHHKNKSGYTALLLSAENGHLDCLTFLLQEGANIHHKNRWGNTALLLSAYKGKLNCAKHLVQQGAYINFKNKNGYAPLLLSTEKGHLDCIIFLRKQGADIHDKNKWNNTPLLLSAYKGHLNCLKFLVQQGADINARNQCGSTALLLSIYRQHVDCLKHLYQQGADINAKDKEGYTPLLWSARKGYLDCLMFLLQQGADIYATNKRKNTALLLSAYHGNLDCLKYLIQKGANIHDKNEQGNTPLLCSAHKGQLDCLKYLIQQGANIHDKNKQGNTALLLSAQAGHLDCLNFLFTSVDLRNTNLQGINLSQALLPDDLSKTNLSNTNLTGHHFTTTNFEGTQLAGAILTNTLCDYQQCFQSHLKTKSFTGGGWYLNNLPKDLKSIAQVYPQLTLDRHKAELLQIASGLAYLPYWEDTEFYIKVYYWSCKLFLLKKQLDSTLGNQLVCTLITDLEEQAQNYCWGINPTKEQANEATAPLHNPFDQYLNTFQAGLQHYNCQSKQRWGYHQYKGNIEKNIQGLQKSYPKLTNPKHQQEAIDIASHLSTLYQHQHWDLLLRYLALQNRLINLKISAGIAVSKDIHYDKCP